MHRGAGVHVQVGGALHPCSHTRHRALRPSRVLAVLPVCKSVVLLWSYRCARVQSYCAYLYARVQSYCGRTCVQECGLTVVLPVCKLWLRPEVIIIRVGHGCHTSQSRSVVTDDATCTHARWLTATMHSRCRRLSSDVTADASAVLTECRYRGLSYSTCIVPAMHTFLTLHAIFYA